MPTKDDFDPDHRLPRFLAREPEQQSLGKAWDRAVISSHVLKASICAAAATALSIAILSVVGNPVTLLADATASLARKSAPQPDTYRSMPTTIQSSADVQTLPTKEVFAREENAASSEPTDPNPTENGEGLFRQFQAWAAKKDEQAEVGPVQSLQDAPAQVVQNAPALVIQNAPAQIVEDARASLKPKQKHRYVRALRDAQAEMRPVHNSRKKVRREQSLRVQDAGTTRSSTRAGPVGAKFPASVVPANLRLAQLGLAGSNFPRLHGVLAAARAVALLFVCTLVL